MIDKETILRIARESDPGFGGIGPMSESICGISKIERFAAAILAHRAESGVEVPFATAFADPLDLVNDANRDIFSVKHASEWHEGLRFNAALFTHDQLLAYGNARAAEALERTAKVCKQLEVAIDGGGKTYFRPADARQCVAAIRSLTP